MAAGIKKDARLEFILKQLELKGAVSVCELSRKLQISEVTIRKDLCTLEKRGCLNRISGGAVPTQNCDRKNSTPYGEKSKNKELKQLVAKKAAELIESGDSLVVTSGMTPHLTLRYAEKCSNLKIVTEGLMIAEDFCRRPDYQVIILGGNVETKNFFSYGHDAVRQVNYYMADKAIVTMDGVDVDAGLTTLRNEGIDVLQFILQRARMRILVADSSKIGLESHCYVGDISYVDILVTNRTDDVEKQKILKRISDAGIRVIYADEEDKEGRGEDLC